MSGSLAQQQLQQLARRRQLRLPEAAHRVDRRGFWQFVEVRERWGGCDPRRYEDITAWFRGRNDVKGLPCGAQVWLDLCRWCGQDPVPYDELPATDVAKLTVEHWFSQAAIGDWSVLRNGLMGLYAVEWGFNNSAEFKTLDSLAERAFLGERTYRNHVAFLGWLHTKRNHTLPSMAFLQSTHCVDAELAAPVYLSSGMRATGRTRQLFLPFGAAQGLRSGVKRARVEEVVDDAAEPQAAATRTTDATTQADAATRVDAATQTTTDDGYDELRRVRARVAELMEDFYNDESPTRSRSPSPTRFSSRSSSPSPSRHSSRSSSPSRSRRRAQWWKTEGFIMFDYSVGVPSNTSVCNNCTNAFEHETVLLCDSHGIVRAGWHDLASGLCFRCFDRD